MLCQIKFLSEHLLEISVRSSIDDETIQHLERLSLVNFANVSGKVTLRKCKKVPFIDFLMGSYNLIVVLLKPYG